MPRLSEAAREVLERVHRAGGCAFIRLASVVYGVPRGFLQRGERARLHALVGSLAQKGLVVVRRDWGTRGYGRATWLEVTEAGVAALAAVRAQQSAAPAPAGAPPANRVRAGRVSRREAVGAS